MNRTELQIAATARRSIPLDEVLSSIASLSTEDRVALLKRLLQQYDFSTVIGTNQPIESLLWQVNQMNRQQLGEILKVIAFRIARE
ncbi:MAG: hypothetical protein NW224_16465 [Leptolyngbyaceae cyanobacterium bins.302]|nr:hypothetical protein [Leptolyngbyaceae cyanobacterium bins.302]